MDASFLPEIFALAIAILLFQPIVARVGRHSNTWLVGWIFLLAHYVVHSLGHLDGWRGVCARLATIGMVELAAICFLRAAGNVHKTRVGWALTLALGVPMVLQSALTQLAPEQALLERVIGILLLIPAVLVWVRKPRYGALTALAVAFAAIGVAVIVMPHVNPFLLVNLLLMCLFFGIAAVYVGFAPARTRASVAAVTGLIAWGVTFPLGILLRWLHPGIVLQHELVVIPQFLFAAGIVFSFIEEVVVRAEHQAQHDPLTGLPNARLFQRRASEAMAQAAATATPIAFLVIDVDEFKKVNDTLGHHAGDELLRSLAVRLSWHIGAGDLLARTGGDEFTAILAGVTDEHHLRFIARAMMSAASVPFVIGGNPLDCRISIGIAVAQDTTMGVPELREAADQAMYEAKRKGGSVLAFAGEGGRPTITLQ